MNNKLSDEIYDILTEFLSNSVIGDNESIERSYTQAALRIGQLIKTGTETGTIMWIDSLGPPCYAIPDDPSLYLSEEMRNGLRRVIVYESKIGIRNE